MKSDIVNNKFANRIIEIDVLRGICVFLMIFDHAFYDIFGVLPILTNFPIFGKPSYDVYEFAMAYWVWDVREVMHYIVCFIFLAITGICCSFSKSNIKRGVQLLIVALGLTAVTLIVGNIIGDIDAVIVFGVLHCIAVSLIIIGFLEKFIPHKHFYLVTGIIMTVLGIFLEIDSVYLSFNTDNAFKIVFETILGINSSGSDHFPIFLNGGQIFIGVFLGKQLYSERKSLFKNAKYKNNIVTFTGRNSLIMYFAHQIILPIIMVIILLICGFRISI